MTATDLIHIAPQDESSVARVPALENQDVVKPLSTLQLLSLLSGLSAAQQERLKERLVEPLTPEKSGISIDHIIGCPLGCAYCVRHNFGAFDIRRPYLIESDESVVRRLMRFKYFKPHVTPLKIFTQATDAMVPAVKPHLFNTLRLLDECGLTNHMLVITRFVVSEDDCKRLNALKHLRVSLLITYSGITDPLIEPVDSRYAVASLMTSYTQSERFKVIAYWRPIISGLNDSNEHIDFVLNDLAKHAHAVVFTGLRQTSEIKAFFQKRGVSELYNGAIDRRKIFPDNLEERILSRLCGSAAEGKLFRKTSCGVSAAHGRPDYNGHFVIGEDICSICSETQRNICSQAHRAVTREEVVELGKTIGLCDLRVETDEIGGIISIAGIEDKERYYLRHVLGHTILDPRFPHVRGQYGRADKMRSFGNGALD